jgi:ectoine hydroxylase-related dioxygenase (phytanoyl-CoA dioxygenase family)
MIPVAKRAETAPYVASLIDHGFVHFQGIYSQAQVATFRSIYEQAAADWRYVNGSESSPDAVGALLERFPRQVLHALTHPVLLGFAEAVMGPFVQLDSVVVNSDSPVDIEHRMLPVMWHRDRFGSLPPSVYVRPASIVFLSYLQPMTDDVGPLRVIPGSHRHARQLGPDELCAALPDELLIRTEPGDVVAIHHNLMHAGTRNTSHQDRRFFGFIFQLSTLRSEDNFSGPNCQALARSARICHDRRLMRLIGEDPLIFPRQNSGFTSSHEGDWRHWNEEDLAYGGEAAVAAAAAAQVRSDLAL